LNYKEILFSWINLFSSEAHIDFQFAIGVCVKNNIVLFVGQLSCLIYNAKIMSFIDFWVNDMK